MKSLLFRSACLSLAAGLCTAVQAQTDDDIPIDFFRPKQWTFSAGVHAGGQTAKVKFGRLGTVPTKNNLVSGGRLYDDGYVQSDGLRVIETADFLDKQPTGEAAKTSVAAAVTDASFPGYYFTQAVKTKTTTVDGVTTTTIETDASGNAIPIRTGQYLRYQDGVTRSWAYRDASQVQADGTIAMNNHSALTDGEGVEAEKDTGAGVELSLGRSFGRLGKRFEWGVTATIAIADINVKTTGTVNSTLRTETDYYSLNGQMAPIFTQPSFDTFENSEGTKFLNASETTTVLASVPTGPTQIVDTAGAAEVDGYWQIKGSYYLIRVGPNVRATLMERLSLNASVGFAGAYLGTKYRIDESFIIPNTTTVLREQVEDSDSQFVAGFYGDLTAELWLTERTGFYAGASYENLGKYKQVLNGRTADVDLGSGLGWRFGIITRF